jgi:hypothetical protein
MVATTDDLVMTFLGSVAGLIGYLVTVAREKGWDGVEVVAVFIKVATPYREHSWSNDFESAKRLGCCQT